MPKQQTICVGQRLRSWDGTHGYVAQNSVGKLFYAHGEQFKIEWVDSGEVIDSQFCTLEQLSEEGISRARGLMPWARK